MAMQTGGVLGPALLLTHKALALGAGWGKVRVTSGTRWERGMERFAGQRGKREDRLCRGESRAGGAAGCEWGERMRFCFL